MDFLNAHRLSSGYWYLKNFFFIRLKKSLMIKSKEKFTNFMIFSVKFSYLKCEVSEWFRSSIILPIYWCAGESKFRMQYSSFYYTTTTCYRCEYIYIRSSTTNQASNLWKWSNFVACVRAVHKHSNQKSLFIPSELVATVKIKECAYHWLIYRMMVMVAIRHVRTKQWECKLHVYARFIYRTVP